VSGLAGVAHVLVSLLLGAVIIAIGLQFRSVVEHAQGLIVGGVLIATGVGFAVLELSGRGHRHSENSALGHSHVQHYHHHRVHDESDAQAARGRLRGLTGVMVPFGAAASPDLTILPVFLAAGATGAATALGSLLAFAAVTIGTIVTLTLVATFGGYRLHGRWLERWGNAITAGTLVAIGTLVVTGAI
jgi:hypothetical protein